MQGATVDPIGRPRMGNTGGSGPDEPVAPRREPGPGVLLGRYEIERWLGDGGMGKVFAARHVETGEAVALKVLGSTTATRLYRFKREFRALADVTHRNLVRLRELVVPEAGPAFFTMELLDGQPFVRWVRGATPSGELPDIERLEDGLRQLVEGVMHLHAHDCIHRDLKPSNVLVTTGGRVVVLDFGLVSELSEPERGITRDRQIVGTPSYMAPEQALGKQTGPAADLYAIGVMLFECLTGRLPHEGAALEQLLAKHDKTVDPGLHIVEGMPEPLRMSCVRLLGRDPDSRPGGRELLAQLRAPAVSTAAPPGRPTRSFVGRTQELGTLHAALHEASQRQRAVVLHLRGKSGDGKSALLRQFRSELRETDTVVLHGRCRAQETVPYKGVDAIVDALSAHLRRLPRAERAALRPPDLDALVRLFPVLDEIWERPEPQSLGWAEVRKLGGVTLRKLLRRVAGTCPLVVHIDDFQWADLDSVSLLDALARPPEEPAMLLLLSYRSEAASSEVLRELGASEILAGSEARTIELGPLSAADARELAEALLRPADPGARPTQAEAIALRSRGSPFFIVQLVLAGETPGSDSDLDQVLVRRLSKLDHDARRLLELVAVFGGPADLGLACELCGVGAKVVDALCEQGLLVKGDDLRGERESRVEAAHDRVREVVLAQLAADVKIRLHGALGERLLARCDGEPVGDLVFAVFDHLLAGVSDPAALPTERRLQLVRLGNRAGQRALESGAWVSARRYFGFACTLLEPELPDAREGRAEHELCVEVVFGRGQAEIALNDPAGDAAVEDLTQWALSRADHGRIGHWYCESLLARFRPSDCIEFGRRALTHLGVRIPRRPSWPRAMLSHVRGVRALRASGLERLASLPLVSDDHVRASLDILACVAGAAMTTDIKLHLTLMGAYGRLLTRYGLHGRVSSAIALLALSTATRGRTREAELLCHQVEELLTRPSTSTDAWGAQSLLMMTLPFFRPLRSVAVHSEQLYRRACEVAPRSRVEWIAFFCAMNLEAASVPVPRLLGFLEAFEAQHGELMLPWVAQCVAELRRMGRAVIEGDHELGLPETLTDLPLPLQVSFTASGARWALLLGRAARAWDLTLMLFEHHERDRGASRRPAHAVVSTVVLIDRWPSATPRERRRMRRMIRTCQATARQWVPRCPESYQPMLDIVEAEVASMEGRHEHATATYERAWSTASEQGLSWLAGLASERLAKLARRRGQTILAEGAFDAAREAYETWGATAVVLRLDRDRAAGR